MPSSIRNYSRLSPPGVVVRKTPTRCFTGFRGAWEIVNKQAMQYDYVECVKQAGVSRRSMQTSLGMNLRRLLPPGFPQSVTTTSDHNGFSVTAPHYRFPPIDVCRKFFEDAVGLKGYDWGEALEATTS